MIKFKSFHSLLFLCITQRISQVEFRRSVSGFTLLEMVIAVLIMSFLAFWSFQSIKKTTQSRKKIESNISDFSAVRNALSIISYDVNRAFHWADVTDEIKKQMN